MQGHLSDVPVCLGVRASGSVESNQEGTNLTIGPFLITESTPSVGSSVFLNEQKSIFFMIFKHFRLQNCFKPIKF